MNNNSFIQSILLIGLVFSINSTVNAQTDDFGDAPDSYLTLDASGGPKHTTTATLTLGSSFDIEADGTPDDFAYGDDNSGSDDEDAELFRSLDPGTTYSDDLAVVNNTGGNALLNVWVDFNIDGDFLDAGEQVATDQVVANGAATATLSFAVPASPTLGQSYVRIRLCSSGCNTPGGAAGDGEVEDYVVIVMNQTPCGTTAYMVQGNFSIWNSIDLLTGGSTSMFDDFSEKINATGYNRTDNRMWGYAKDRNDGSLTITVKNPSGTFTTRLTKPITGMVPGNFLSSDVDAQGIFYITRAAGEMRRVNIDPSSPTYLQFLGILVGSNGGGGNDLAIHPNNNYAYGVDDSNGHLSQINLSTGALVDLGVSGCTIARYGAIFFDASGYMYAYNNDTGEIFRLDLTSDPGADYDETQTVLFATSVPASTNDGAMCADAFLSIDYGDAPDIYGTSISADGPRSFIDPNLRIGATIGSDPNGQPGTNADGDIDDGVASFPTQAVAGVYTLTGISTYNNTGGDAMLCGWFDFNQMTGFDNTPNTSTTGDDPNVGSAVDTGERSCIIIPDGTTSADLAWTIPTAELSNTGNFYFRFRITTDASFFSSSSPSPLGSVSDGEVEDYLADDISLPVELSYFGVESTTDGVLAKWTTESETENLGFTLDRRVEGTEAWSEIATYQTNDALLGQGSTPSATDYEYLDALVTAGTTYEYRLADVDYNNTVTYHATRTVTVISTPSTREVPDEFTVKEAYPNPFNPSTTIDYSLPVIASGAKQSQVQLQIYDITGKLITTLIDQVQPSGWHSVQWNGKDRVGINVPAGAYLVRVKAGTDVRHTKVMLLK